MQEFPERQIVTVNDILVGEKRDEEIENITIFDIMFFNELSQVLFLRN